MGFERGGSLKKTLRVNGSKFQYESLFCGLTPVAKNAAVLLALKYTGKKTTGFLRTDTMILFCSRVSLDLSGSVRPKIKPLSLPVNTGCLYLFFLRSIGIERTVSTCSVLLSLWRKFELGRTLVNSAQAMKQMH